MTDKRNHTALDGAAMETLMAAFAPFECRPHLAVAVSGGPDSMALTLLADAWARRRGGRITALTVDHGLRPESAAEAARVGGWLAGRGIAHEILVWDDDKPVTGVQAKARAARYRLLGDWCRRAGVLHVLLAHQQDDQAETFMLRLGAGSGVDGLAAMSGVRETSHMRLLRPLLTVPRRALLATLTGHGQDWIDDPSNDDPTYARVRIRQSLARGDGVDIPILAETTIRMAGARMALESEASRQMARCCRVLGSGYARLDAGALFDSEDEISLRVLARVLMCIGGREHAPALAKLERLHDSLKGATLGRLPGATLGRCRVVADAPGGISVFRESRGLPVPLRIDAGQTVHWDGRFSLRLGAVAAGPVSLGPLGEDGWSNLLKTAPEVRAASVPRTVALTLPTLSDAAGIATVAYLYKRDDGAPAFDLAGFHPPQTLSAVGFAVAN
ncbi:MAG: tRNA lysidine(34) synthetase TilS [Alphaproteobacteria bacterium]